MPGVLHRPVGSAGTQAAREPNARPSGALRASKFTPGEFVTVCLRRLASTEH